jgi:predicted  nucleic acid-binding Zn-ribbon protein
MARKKRTSRVLEKAQKRFAGLKSIEPKVRFDENYNLDKMLSTIEHLRKKVEVYNTALSVVDSSRGEIEELEKDLSQLSEKMLMVVAIKYGKDSREYEMAGGVRNSDRARKIRASRLKSATEKAAEDTVEVG